jgi:hypothetical protein
MKRLIYKRYRKGNKRGGQTYHTVIRSGWKRDWIIPKLQYKIRLVNPKNIILPEVEEAIIGGWGDKIIGTKSRKKIDEIKVSGDIRKPVTVHGPDKPGEKLLLIDGHHRVIASLERGDEKIPVKIWKSLPNQQEGRKLERRRQEAQVMLEQ